MKRISKALILILAAGLISSCNQLNARRAVQVNDDVVSQHRQLMSSLERFITSLDSRDKDSIQGSLDALKSSANDGANSLLNITSPDCNSSFLTTATTMFQFYDDASQGEYAIIAEFYYRDSISYDEYDSLQQIVQTIESKQREVDQNFLNAQQSFARSCGFKLVRNVK